VDDARNVAEDVWRTENRSPMKSTNFMSAAVRFAVRRPLWTLGCAAACAALGLGLAVNFMEVRTSNLDLVSSDLPVIGAFDEFAHEFGTPNTLILVMEGATPQERASAVDQLAPAIAELSGVLVVVSRDPGKSSLVFDRDERYLTSDDGEMYFLFIQPDDPRSRAVTIEPFVRSVREAVAALELDRQGIRVGFTGLPQYALDDRTTIESDITKLSAVAFVAILTLFTVAFRSMVRPFLALISLLFGVAATLGVAAIYPGHLTLLSAFFASILFGLGIDAAIHIINQMEPLLDDGEPLETAIVSAVVGQAPALWTGALTTSFAFFSMNLTDFSGFAELGTIAGVGVLLCLLSTITVLPALLFLKGDRGTSNHNRTVGLFDKIVMGSLHWLQRPAFAIPIGVVAVLAAFSPGPEFDSDYLNLQPRDSETVRLERAMVERSSFSPVFAGFTVDSVDEVAALTSQLQAIDGVGAVRSIHDAMRAVTGGGDELPRALLSRFKGRSGRYAVYAYPRENVWEAEAQTKFITQMRAVDPKVTGMPFVTAFMADLSKRAMLQCAAASALLLLLLVYASFRNMAATLVVATPVILTVVVTRAVLAAAGLSLNPLAIMAWPVILGIAIDDSLHLTHRFRVEDGGLDATVRGTGRSVTLTSLTTIAAFGALALTSHRGLGSFGLTVAIGVSVAWILSVSILPGLLSRFRVAVLKQR
jgi:predicted RND superfamily exporter protein